MSDDAMARARQFRAPISERRGVVISYRKPIRVRVSIGKRRYVEHYCDTTDEALAWAEAEKLRVGTQHADFVPLPRRR
jgi:hypothetical protein